jgi:hypothetical protein
MKHIRSILTVILVGFILSGPAFTQPQRLAGDPRVASALEFLGVWLEAQRACGQIPGVSAAVGVSPAAGATGARGPGRNPGLLALSGFVVGIRSN